MGSSARCAMVTRPLLSGDSTSTRRTHRWPPVLPLWGDGPTISCPKASMGCRAQRQRRAMIHHCRRPPRMEAMRCADVQRCRKNAH